MNSVVRLIARREIVTRLQQKGFRIGTAVTLVLIVLACLAPKVIKGGSSSTVDIAVAGKNSAPLSAALAAVGSARGLTVHVHPTSADEARAKVRSGAWDAAIIDDTEVVATTSTATAVTLAQSAHIELATVAQLQGAGLSTTQIHDALAVAALPVAATKSDESAQRQAIATITVVVLFGQLMTYCIWVATGVVEEKSSRVVELLLSAVRPFQLLAGKLLGIGALAVGQVALFGIVALGVSRAAGTLTLAGSGYLTVLVGFLGFVLGFAVFAALCAGLASTVSRQEEVSGVLSPVTILLMLSYFVSIAVAASPNFPLARVLSIIPPVSALTMPARIARGNVPAVDMVAAAVLLIAAALAVLWVAARVYRAAILHTGGKLSLKAAWRGEAVGELA